MRSKENRTEAITPKRSTMKIMKTQLPCKKNIDPTSIKDLLPPFLENMLASLPTLTPLKKQPQFLLSPSPVKKDLFSQLLGSQVKNSSPYNNHTLYENSMIMEEEDNQYMDDESIRSDSEDHSEITDSENDCGWDDQNGTKKRKRKSTVQIKILKQELEGEGEINWTKQKITRMAEITGLSQSQVYKWCWDQKKKNIKCRDPHKRKLIRKEFAARLQQNQRSEENHKVIKNLQIHDHQIFEARTKLKVGAILQESDLNTQKKINKKLIFN